MARSKLHFPWASYTRSFLLFLGGYVFCRLLENISDMHAAALFAKHDFVEQESAASASDSAADRMTGINVTKIAEKWGLSSPNAVSLLEQQARLDLDYNKERDFLVFAHPMKSGGTSISLILNQTFGGAYPGSRESGAFAFNIADQAVKDGVDMNAFKVAYAHVLIRPSVGPEAKQSQLAKHLRSTLQPGRRIRQLTMIRDPVALRASNFAEWLCGYNQWLQEYNRQHKTPGSCKANFTAMMELRGHHMLTKECPNNPPGYTRQKQCEKLKNGIDPFKHCHSISALLEDDIYTIFRNMNGHIQGRYTRDKDDLLTNLSTVITEPMVQEVEDYTLTDLGALDPGPNKPADADFVWFGITERMHESTCLLFYTFKVNATEIPRRRQKSCRPTYWWTEQDKDVVREREPLDYAFTRAANAILDVRMLKMQNEIQALFDAGASLEDIPHVGPGCFQGKAASSMFSI